MASAIAGVPASKRPGGGAYVEWSRYTSWIISPPPIHGRMDSSSSSLPHRKPTPVGPHILCPLPTIQSAPSACVSPWFGQGLDRRRSGGVSHVPGHSWKGAVGATLHMHTLLPRCSVSTSSNFDSNVARARASQANLSARAILGCHIGSHRAQAPPPLPPATMWRPFNGLKPVLGRCYTKQTRHSTTGRPPERRPACAAPIGSSRASLWRPRAAPPPPQSRCRAPHPAYWTRAPGSPSACAAQAAL
eukprot:364731-Chlamydomonas_euryale.AAC.9